MVDVWAVIGNTNDGKSSTIRALTGVSGKRSSWDVSFAPNSAGIPTFVHPQGLQERPISPAAFIAEVTKARATKVIVALRYKRARKQPDAATYLRAFRAAGWNIVGYVALNQAAATFVFPHGSVVPGRSSLASNEIARRLRRQWGFA